MVHYTAIFEILFVETVAKNQSWHYATDIYRLKSRYIYFPKMYPNIASILAYKSHLNFSYFSFSDFMKNHRFFYT